MMATTRARLLAALLSILLAACGNGAAEDVPAQSEIAAPKPKLGLMTSLPLYWPLGAEFGDIAAGETEVPWQRTVIEDRYEIVPLDTLSPIAGLTPDAPEIDPLAGLDRLAIVQPRGLSPADNVALDEWVKEGGHLLLVLDPMLTGEYDLPLGDPRRPTDTALIPPVVARWGLSVGVDETQAADGVAIVLPGYIPFNAIGYGEIAADPGAGVLCRLEGEKSLAQCRVGEGRLTLLADAAVFEHLDAAVNSAPGSALFSFLGYALD